MITSKKVSMNWSASDAANRGARDSTRTSQTKTREDRLSVPDISRDRSSARVFIGIKVAPEIAEELATLARCLEAYPVRLIRPADIHLTLVPPWTEANIAGAIETLRNALGPFSSFDLVFQRAQYGPTLERPRLLWVECPVTTELAELHKQIAAAFERTDELPFRPHATLVRIPKHGRKIARETPIDRKLLHMQRVRSIELFGTPKRADEGYHVIASLPLHDAADRASSSTPC
jgi:2'-5' RNA ligase